MKRFIIPVLLCLIAISASAKGSIDPKYGIGAVPVNENGRVSFTDNTDIPSGMNADKCYDILLKWAKGRFAQPYAQAGRILSENSESRRFVFHVDQTITFKRTALVLDVSRIEYNYTVSVKDGKVTANMTDIKYRYEEGRENGGQAFTAEDWITDNEAFNAKKTKFLKSTGKFRIKTIDLKDNLFQSLKEALDGNN